MTIDRIIAEQSHLERAELARLAEWLWAVTEFCLAHRGRWCFKGWQRAKLFRYVAFCELTGRLYVVGEAASWDSSRSGAVAAVAFGWPGWAEHIEARAAEGTSQFEWSRLPRKPDGSHAPYGDSGFIAEVILAPGQERRALRGLWMQALRRYPDLGQRKLFSYRRGKLVRLERRAIWRLFRGRRT